MTAPTRFRGATATVPGRLTVPVRVPADLLDEAARIAERLGEDRAVVLGDLVAGALPAALAEAADDLVGAFARERLAVVPTSDDPGPEPGAVCDSAPTSSPTVIVAVPAPELEPCDGPPA